MRSCSRRSIGRLCATVNGASAQPAAGPTTPAPPPPPPLEAVEEGEGEAEAEGEEGGKEEGEEEDLLPPEVRAEQIALMSFEKKLEKAREIAIKNPKVIANLLKEWMGTNANERR